MAEYLVAWSDDFLIGNETIDSQHKELVRMTNEFYAGVEMGGEAARDCFHKTIKGAIQYIETHFVTEQEIMRKAKFPLYHEHKRQHDDFINEVVRQVMDKGGDKKDKPAEFVKFLMDWIINHVANSDKKISPYLEKLG